MTRDELIGLLEPTIERLGYELSDLEVRIGGKHGVLRVFIDKPLAASLEDARAIAELAEQLYQEPNLLNVRLHRLAERSQRIVVLLVVT